MNDNPSSPASAPKISGVFLPVDVIETEGGMRVSDIVAALRRRWLVVVVLAICFGVLSWAGTWSVTPIYEAVVGATVRSDDATSSSGGLGSLAASGLAAVAGIDLGKNDRVRNAMALLQSDAFAQRFIIANDCLPLLFPDSWNSESKSWRKTSPSINAAIEKFSRDIRKAHWNSETGVLSVAIRLRDRLKAAQWANALIDQLNREARQNAIDEADKSIRYLERELSKTSVVDVQQSVYKVIETQVKAQMLANIRDDYLLTVIDPARVSDADAFVFPRRFLITALGAMFGMSIGVSIAVFDIARAKRRTLG